MVMHKQKRGKADIHSRLWKYISLLGIDMGIFVFGYKVPNGVFIYAVAGFFLYCLELRLSTVFVFFNWEGAF